MKVGTICIGQNIHSTNRYNGMECEIIGPLERRRGRDLTTGRYSYALRYKVRWSNHEIHVTEPYKLRPKHPPSGEDAILRLFNEPAHA